MTRDELSAMSQEELSEYFLDNARYDPRNKYSPYSIMGPFRMSSSDTYDLAQRFYAAVKRYRGTLYGKNGEFSR